MNLYATTRNRSNILGKVLCIFILGLTLGPIASHGWGSSHLSKSSDSPEDLEHELQDLLSNGMAQSQHPKELCRLASMYLDLGHGLYVNQEKKLASFQEGARMAKRALDRQETSPDAHFLYAANLGSAVELQGVMSGALTIQELKHHVRRVLELDATYAPAHHMLGRMYQELPWFLGGDQESAGEHLKKSVSLDKRYVPGRLDLARWYMKHGFQAEAVRELTVVVDNPPREKIWIWEKIHRPEAQELLRQLPVFDRDAS